MNKNCIGIAIESGSSWCKCRRISNITRNSKFIIVHVAVIVRTDPKQSELNTLEPIEPAVNKITEEPFTNTM